MECRALPRVIVAHSIACLDLRPCRHRRFQDRKRQREIELRRELKQDPSSAMVQIVLNNESMRTELKQLRELVQNQAQAQKEREEQAKQTQQQLAQALTQIQVGRCIAC